MKKSALLILSLFLAANVAVAKEGPDAERAAHREAMKKIKQTQRENKKTQAPVEEKKGPTFWDREWERSGLGKNQSSVGTFLKNLNPVPFFKDQKERYEARKTGAVK